MNYQKVLSSAAFWEDTKSNWQSIQFYLLSIAGSFSVISLLWYRFSLVSYHSLHTCMLSCFSHVWFFATLWTVAHQAPLSMGVSKQEYWSRLPFPLPGDLPSPGTELASCMSPALTGRFFTTEPSGKPSSLLTCTFTTNSFLVSLCPEYPPPIKHDLIDEGLIFIRHPFLLHSLQCPLFQFSSVQSLSCVRLFATPWTAARQASLSITNSQSLPKLMFIGLVMPSNHLILCRPLLLLPSIFPRIRVFSNELALHIRWPKYWSFSFNIIPLFTCPPTGLSFVPLYLFIIMFYHITL